jgi:sodium/potassium-transporting ATPase subunit alpha
VCVTLSLLIIAKRMGKNRVLVKNLSVVETLSCVNVIASDKTGTLTQNKMFVANAMAGLDIIDIDILLEDTKATKQLIGALSLCSNSHFEENDKNPILELRQAIGDATDVALLRFTSKHKQYTNKTSSYREVSKLPFNSRNKWMVTVIKSEITTIKGSEEKEVGLFDEQAQSQFIFIKGAPDILLKKCAKIIQNDGSEVELGEDTREKLTQIQDEWCLSGQRVILICKRVCTEKESENLSLLSANDFGLYVKFDCNDFTLIGMIGIIDPPREGIADVVATCREASIRVLMVTGDYLITAAAIAKRVGIITNPDYDTLSSVCEKVKAQEKSKKIKSAIAAVKKEGSEKENDSKKKTTSLVLNGSDLVHLTSVEWRVITKYDEIVFARTTPEQKLTIVKGKYLFQFFIFFSV